MSDRRFLPLKFVYRANPSAQYAVLQLEHLRIVGGDDQYVVEFDRRFVALAIYPRGVRCQNLGDQRFYLVSFLRRRALVALMNDGKIPEARTGYPAGRPDLPVAPIRAASATGFRRKARM